MTWQDYALCFGSDPAWWDTDNRGQPRLGRAVCARCPVREACLAAALDEEHGLSPKKRSGIRGGVGPDQRAAMAGYKGNRTAWPDCAECSRVVRKPRARYCDEHQPKDAERRSVNDRARRAAA